MQRLKDTFRRKLSSGDPLGRNHDSGEKKYSSKDKYNNCQLTIPTTGRQVRSSSCDEIVFKQVAASLASIGTGGIGIMDTVLMDELSHQQHTFSGSTLELPTPVGRSTRSKSFDCTTGKTKKGRNSQGSIGFLEIPKWRMLIRRSSSQSAERGGSLGSIFGDKCIHCALIEEAFNLQLLISSNRSSVSSVGSPDLETRGSLSDDNRQTDELSKKPDCNDEEDEVIGDDDVICDGDDNEKRSGERNTRHSRGDLLIATAAAHSVDYPFETRRGNGITSTETKLGKSSSLNDECLISPEEGLPLVTLSAAPELELLEPTSPESLEDLGNGITVISLEVPVIKQNRSASIDASFLKVPERYEIIPETELPPCKTHRSNSVDITLPTKPGDFYMVLRSMKATPIFEKKAIQGEIKISTENGETRTLRSAPDWGETAINGDHLWVSTSASGDLCYVGENECSKQGPRLCCPACKITAHTGCIGILIDKIKFHCKPTFKDVGVRQYREQTVIHHHWAHRRHQKGRCRQCGKSFQSKLSFGNKEIVALSCSWCKTNYHNKESCFSMERLTETCNMGIHADLIVPPSWIVKLPRKGSFKSSIRRSPKNKRSSSKRRTKKDDSSGSTSEYSQHLPVHPILPIHSGSSSPPPDAKIPVTIPGGQHRSFAIKPIPSSTSKPLLVFINPKSGGNQGSKLMQKFQWLLNPRQVFDLTQGGPKPGLELYKKVPNLRILACGGDGTAGWILSTLDDLGLNPNPPLAVLPLGTGNDLARALGWGGGYTDEPMSKILLNIKDGEVVQLDRWTLKVTRNTDAALNDLANDPSENGKETLPLNVVNNYFSIGVDAHIALEFHEAREAHPERFNSRLRNKMFYGQAGGKDLLQRKWKDLCGFITLECDGVDLTQRLRDLRIHSLLFLNIPSYGGGTRPWGTNSPSYENPRTDDGLIEVIGLTTYQLPLLQAGGHGSCIAQCRSARIITSRTIPMQVDGEPCRLLPSVIELELHNQANMIAKAKSHSQIAQIPLEREFTLEIRKLNLTDYETYHYDKERLKDASVLLGMLTISPDLELDRVRVQINKLVHGIDNREAESRDDNEGRGYRLRSKFSLSSDWCFVDACTAERFFRVDKAQEHLHYVVDICNEDTNRMLYILDPADESKIEDCSATSIPNLLADPDLNASLEFTNIEERNNNNTIVLLKGSMDGSMDKGEDGASDSNWKGGSASASSLEPRHVYLDKDLGKERCQGNDNSNDGNRQNKKVDNVLSATPPKSVKVEKVSTEIINAARQGNFERVKTLLHEGYSSLAVDENGMTALHHAADHGYEDIVQLLVQEEPHLIDIPDCEEGQTALHKAARNRRQKVCCILAAAGCSLSKLDNSGLTARQIAEQVQDQELAAYLQHFENYQNTLRDKETTV